MRRGTWSAAAAAGLLAVAAVGGVVVLSRAGEPAPAARTAPARTAPVERGKLAAVVSLNGTLTYRARPDGSPYPVVNRAGGTYTELPEVGARVGCGDVLYRVDDRPVLLLCGAVPAYRELRVGSRGRDVRQLNRNLHRLGYDADPGSDAFGWRTAAALRRLQRRERVEATGTLAVADAVFLPEPIRVAQVTGTLGGSTRAGAQALRATSDKLVVQVRLDASQRGELKAGDRARVTLPGNVSATGRVDRIGTVARAPAGQDADATAATIPAFVALDRPAAARGLDAAPVQVEIATRGVADALSVPVLALVGKSGDGFAVEVVRDGGRRELVAVRLGLFDSTAGRVAVDGALDAGDRVVVPAL